MHDASFSLLSNSKGRTEKIKAGEANLKHIETLSKKERKNKQTNRPKTRSSVRKKVRKCVASQQTSMIILVIPLDKIFYVTTIGRPNARTK